MCNLHRLGSWSKQIHREAARIRRIGRSGRTRCKHARFQLKCLSHRKLWTQFRLPRRDQLQRTSSSKLSLPSASVQLHPLLLLEAVRIHQEASSGTQFLTEWTRSISTFHPIVAVINPHIQIIPRRIRSKDELQSARIRQWRSFRLWARLTKWRVAEKTSHRSLTRNIQSTIPMPTVTVRPENHNSRSWSKILWNLPSKTRRTLISFLNTRMTPTFQAKSSSTSISQASSTCQWRLDNLVRSKWLPKALSSNCCLKKWAIALHKVLCWPAVN